MGRLHHTKFYLAGPVEFASHFWRKLFAEKLITFEPTAIVWNPLSKPNWAPNDSEAAFDRRALFSASPDLTARRAASYKSNKNIRRVCIKLANHADILIVHLPKVFTWGTIKEIEDCITRGIPIFLVAPDGPLGVFGIPGFIDDEELIPEYVHFSEESLLRKLAAISQGIDTLPERDPERWLSLSFPNYLESLHADSPIKARD